MTDRQRRFAEEFAACGNGAKAAREAGYSSKTARSQGQRLLTNADILQYIRQLQDQAAAARIVSATQIKAFWSDTVNDPTQKTADRLKASELLARSAGLFLHVRPGADDGTGRLAVGEISGEDVILYLPEIERIEDCQAEEGAEARAMTGPDRGITDAALTRLYEGNGLFARIIDLPAEEATRGSLLIHGDVEGLYAEILDDLAWEETFSTAAKWTRLYGSAVAVMLIDDGQGLESPLDWEHIRGIDGIRVYACPSVHPVLRGGKPELFHVSSKNGSFVVHASRCLVFRGDPASERTEIPRHEQWGISEGCRIIQAVQRAEVTHRTAVKLLDRSILAVYKAKGLSHVAATEGGEKAILSRLETLYVV